MYLIISISIYTYTLYIYLYIYVRTCSFLLPWNTQPTKALFQLPLSALRVSFTFIVSPVTTIAFLCGAMLSFAPAALSERGTHS